MADKPPAPTPEEKPRTYPPGNQPKPDQRQAVAYYHRKRNKQRAG